MSEKAAMDIKEWIVKNGGYIRDVKYPTLYDSFLNGKYTGIQTNQPITPQSVIISIPSHLLLSVDDAYYSDIAPLFHNHAKIFGPLFVHWQKVMLSTFVIYEMSKEAHSKWYPLFEVWKHTYVHNYYMWSQEEIISIPSKIERKRAIRQMDMVYKTWNTLVLIIKKYPNIFPAKYFNYETYRRIWALSASRSFSSLYEHNMFAPFAEFINHGNVKCSYRTKVEPCDIAKSSIESEFNSDFEFDEYTDKEINPIPLTENKNQPIGSFEDDLKRMQSDYAKSGKRDENLKYDKSFELEFKNSSKHEAYKLEIFTKEQTFDKQSQILMSYGEHSNNYLCLLYTSPSPRDS